MTTNIKIQSIIFGIGVIFSAIFAYGLSFSSIPFQSSFFILISVIVLITGINFIINLNKNQQNSIEKNPDVQELFELINEKDEVIAEYEKLLDEQFVNIPCNCGGDLFQGILLPNSENLTECKNCKEKYKIFVSYDSILVAQPADNNTIFENLINKKLE